MSQKEVGRLAVVQQVVSKQLSQQDGATRDYSDGF